MITSDKLASKLIKNWDKDLNYECKKFFFNAILTLNGCESLSA